MRTVFIDGHGKCEVWKLPKMSSPKQRKYRYTPESFTHPAKMHVVLCRKIIKTYTELGEIVLDPMCGVSTTQIEAALLGRNAVGTDLESKFIKISKKNIKLLKKLRTLAPKGEAVVLKGDARKLSELLSKQADSIIFSPPFARDKGGEKGMLVHDIKRKNDKALYRTYTKGPANIDNLPYGKRVDAVVFSPPFAGTSGGKGKKSRTPINARYPGLFERCIGGNKGGISSDPRNIDNKPYGSVDAIITSPPFGDAQRGGGIAQRGYDGPKHGPTDLMGKRSYMPENVGESKGQISRLDYGSVDAIITSPPYSELAKRDRFSDKHGKRIKGMSRCPNYKYSDEAKNIGNLPHGQVDAIVTSPPYEEAMGKKHHSPRADKIAEEKSLPTTYIKRADVIITSPPYEGSLEGTSRHTKGGIPERDPKLGQTGFYRSGSVGNIGNLKSETYFSAMLQVYAECCKVLKSGGLMVLVIKDFIRNKKVVRLDLDTKRLCEAVGFWWVETKLFRLQGKSFWRVLYEQKHPEVDVSLLQYEFVEVFQKPLEACAGGDA